MRQEDGKCRITGIEVGEVSIDFFRVTPLLNAKYAYLVGTLRAGSNHKNQWGQAVMAKVKELQDVMEEELGADLFDVAVATGGAETSEKPQEDQIDSL